MTDSDHNTQTEAQSGAGAAVETSAQGAETLGFQSEVTELLNLMIHSLYSNREIFLRELVSNASDAIDKLRFLSLSDDSLFEGDPELRVEVSADTVGRTLTVRDNGVGMNRAEVIENLGTIARSGTRSFFENLTGDSQKDARLIGQFGVGFYSAFIVADEVVVRTRKAGEPAANGVEWRSAGKGEFTVTSIERDVRGTEIVLHLKEDANEFANDWQLRSIIKRYSDHIDVPVMMPVPHTEADENTETDEGAECPAGGADADAQTFERVNDGQALWLKSKNELSDEDYQGFYKQFTHDFDDPMSWVHSQVEGKLEYSSLFFIPKNAPFDLWDRDARRGVKLYVQRVFIMEDEEQILPRYLRFVRGLVDTNDLPLNVSREILQRNRVIDSISTASVKKVLGMIEGLAKDEETYRPFWLAFGRVLKEGLVEDANNRERLTALMRMHSTGEATGEDACETVSFEAYRSRMPESQKSIYYLLGDDLKAVRNSPLLEVFKQRGFEVLLLTDPVDEWWVNHVTEIDGVPLKSISQGELDFEIDAEAGTQTKLDEGFSGRVAEALGARVSAVRASARLTDSPACLVTAEGGMTRQLEQMLRAAGQEVPEQKPVLEINPSHPIVRQLEGEQNAERFADTACLLFDQAVIADGGRVEDPGAFVRRLNDVLLKVALVS